MVKAATPLRKIYWDKQSLNFYKEFGATFANYSRHPEKIEILHLQAARTNFHTTLGTAYRAGGILFDTE